MPPIFTLTWIMLLGLSLIFVGGFILWAYGARQSERPVDAAGPEREAIRDFHDHLAQWVYFYGIAAIILGVGCLMAVVPRMI